MFSRMLPMPRMPTKPTTARSEGHEAERECELGAGVEVRDDSHGFGWPRAYTRNFDCAKMNTSLPGRPSFSRASIQAYQIFIA